MYRFWIWLNRAQLAKAAQALDEAVRLFREENRIETAVRLAPLLSRLLYLARLFLLSSRALGRYICSQRDGPTCHAKNWRRYLMIFLVVNLGFGLVDGWKVGFSFGFLAHELADILSSGLLFAMLLHTIRTLVFWGIACSFFCHSGVILAERKLTPLARYLRDKSIPKRLDFITDQLTRISLEIDFVVEEITISRKNPKLHFLRVGLDGIETTGSPLIVGAWIGDIEGEKESLKERDLAMGET